MRKELKIFFIPLSPFILSFRVSDRMLSVNKKPQERVHDNFVKFFLDQNNPCVEAIFTLYRT